MTHLPRLVHVSMLSRSHALTSAALRTLFRARPPALCPAAAHAAHSCCWALTRPRTRTRAASAESSCAERAGEACGAKPPVGRRDPDAACGATRDAACGAQAAWLAAQERAASPARVKPAAQASRCLEAENRPLELFEG
jgi:hypothetical protein